MGYNMRPLYSFISLILLGYSCNQVLAGKCMTEPYPTNCHFPFVYNDETYNDCTKVDNWDVPWCSTDPNGDGDCTDCTGASCTTNAHLLTMMDIPGAIQLMVDGETVTGVYVKWKKMNLVIGKRISQTQITETL